MSEQVKVMQAVAAVIFDRDSKGYKFLILKKKGTWVGWQFVQGEKEKEESFEQAAAREINEETGLKSITIVKKLPFSHDYWFNWEGKKIHKFLTFFLVKAASSEKITVSEEHSDYKWCSFDEALKELKFNKEIFREIPKHLKELEKEGMPTTLKEFGK